MWRTLLCELEAQGKLEVARMLLKLLVDVSRFLFLCLRPRPTLAAENLFLCEQLALYQERNINLRRATNATRIALVWLSRWFDWRSALRIVQPETLTRWRRQGFRLFWRWKSRPGRPPIPPELQALICRMARENLTWGSAGGMYLDLAQPRTSDAARQQGKFIAGQPLQNGGQVVAGIAKVITDGPFAEGKEIVGGYLIVRAADRPEAVEICKGCPIFEHGGIVEVRTIQPLNL
jgi:hypothetical protein